MNSQHNCVRCAATGAILAIAAISIAVLSTQVDAREPIHVWSPESGSGVLIPRSRYPEHGYIYQRGDGVQEVIVPQHRRDWTRPRRNSMDRYNQPRGRGQR